MPGPDVVWSSDEDELADDPAALALHAQLRQLVQVLWRRLPAEVRAIIACDLRRIILVPAWPRQGVTYGHGDGDWRPALSWVVVCGFGQAFLWALLTRLSGVNPVRDAVSPEDERLPGSAWIMTMAAGRFGERSVHALLDRMIEALALAWGFGTELATVLELGCCRWLEGTEDWELEPDLRRIARALAASGA